MKRSRESIVRRRHIGRISAAMLSVFLVVASLPLVAGAATAAVSITTTLTPRDVTVAPGTTVTWTNDDGERHRMRTTDGPVEFDSGNIDAGETFSFTFDTEGTYLYVDDRDRDNANYFGSVVVEADTGGEPGTPPPPPPAAGDVVIQNDTFVPASISVAEGGTVTWSNQDRDHTVTARDGSFDSGVFDAGQTYTRTFNTAGTFSYFCIIHPEMTGTVTVTDGSGTAPPPTTPPPTTPPTTAPPPPPPAPGAIDISIVDNDFDPSPTTVDVGTTVRWVNTGALPHTATMSGQFDSGILMAGQTYTRTFNSAGTYDYICTLHTGMTGRLIVQTPGSAQPPPPPPPGNQPPGDENPPPTSPPSAGSGSISIIDNDYSPRSRTVSVGSTVEWANNGALPHTVTLSGQFDSGFLMPGQTYSRTFGTAGTYNYVCILHPGMAGTLVVQAADGTAPEVEPNDPGGDTPTSPGSVAGGISIVDNDYSPRTRTVSVGSTVKWANNGALPHTVTLGGQFDSGILMPGQTYSRTFGTAGTYNYVCTLHPGMAGTLVVQAPDGSAPEVEATEETDAGAGGMAAAAPQGLAVNMIDNAYDPDAIEITAGDSITWTNVGQAPHTVTDRGQSFDSGFVMPGDAWTMTFDTEGTYEYWCTIHPEMVGQITVLAAGVSDGTTPGGAASARGTSAGEAASALAAVRPVPAIFGPAGVGAIAAGLFALVLGGLTLTLGTPRSERT